MELRIGPWVITSDKYQYKLSRIMPKTSKASKKDQDDISEDEGESKSGERLVFVGYYTEIEGILLALLDRELKDQEAENIGELIEGLQTIRVYIRKASNAIIDEIKKLPKEILRGLPDTDNELSVDDALKSQDTMMNKVATKIKKRGEVVELTEPTEPQIKRKRGRPRNDASTPSAQKVTKKGRIIR